MNKMTTLSSVEFSLPVVSSENFNVAAVETVNKYLPEIMQKTRAFDRQNSQHTLSLMTLTMMTGHSPLRMMRQVMAEIEKKQMALMEAQVSHAELLEEIEELKFSSSPVEVAKLRLKNFSLGMLEAKINGSFKDIATLIDAYKNLKAKNNIDEWDETTFEAEEKAFHVRRGFELMYRNLLDGGRAQTSTIEYTAQYGVHPQVALKECRIYLDSVSEAIDKGIVLHANHLEDFLDEMASKYAVCVDATAERLYGKADFTNTDYMLKIEENKGTVPDYVPEEAT